MAEEALKLDWTDVDSSNVDSVAYEPKSRNLCVRFKGGGLYTYEGANQEYFYDMMNAESVGKYLNNVVKVMLPYKKWDSEAEMLAHLTSNSPATPLQGFEDTLDS